MPATPSSEARSLPAPPSRRLARCRRSVVGGSLVSALDGGDGVGSATHGGTSTVADRVAAKEESSASTATGPLSKDVASAGPVITSVAVATPPEANPSTSPSGATRIRSPSADTDTPESLANVHVTVDSPTEASHSTSPDNSTRTGPGSTGGAGDLGWPSSRTKRHGDRRRSRPLKLARFGLLGSHGHDGVVRDHAASVVRLHYIADSSADIRVAQLWPGSTTVSTDGNSMTTPRRSSTIRTTSSGISLVF